MKPYIEIADEITKQIASGAMPVGMQLPPQRRFAFERDIAVSTASRVYEELRRRGLVTGEVGRGTFVSSRFAPLDPLLQERAGTDIDLEIVFRLAPHARDLIMGSTARFFAGSDEPQTLGLPSVTAPHSMMAVFAELTGFGDFCLRKDCLLLSGNGRQAIAAAFSALAPRGGRIAVEALTYPFAIAAARRLGIDLVPMNLDSEGIDPEALDLAARNGLNGVYLQPTLQSPLVRTMSQERRQRIARVLQRHDLVAIEDRVYSFLQPTAPLAAHAPDHVIQIDSLSKRLIPGSTIGLISTPTRYRDELAIALRSGGWMASAMSVSLAHHWIMDGTLDRVEDMKRREAKSMYNIAKDVFAGLDYHSFPEALHGWLSLPNGWRTEAFVASCASMGIAVAPGSAFAVQNGATPRGVRIAYSTPNLTTWKHALSEVAEIVVKASA